MSSYFISYSSSKTKFSIYYNFKILLIVYKTITDKYHQNTILNAFTEVSRIQIR
jgi:hypothetical protein